MTDKQKVFLRHALAAGAGAAAGAAVGLKGGRMLARNVDRKLEKRVLSAYKKRIVSHLADIQDTSRNATIETPFPLRIVGKPTRMRTKVLRPKRTIMEANVRPRKVTDRSIARYRRAVPYIGAAAGAAGGAGGYGASRKTKGKT
jgi:hypothetical protein